jgi:hypothetical protein
MNAEKLPRVKYGSYVVGADDVTAGFLPLFD